MNIELLFFTGKPEVGDQDGWDLSLCRLCEELVGKVRLYKPKQLPNLPVYFMHILCHFHPVPLAQGLLLPLPW